VQELALKTGRPLIGINDGAGARIQEGVVSLGLYSRIFRNNILASGVIPQISLIMGAAAGGHVYSPALTDFVIMVDQTSQMFITGPDVIKTVTGEEVTMEELGGAHTHMAKSGTAHYVASGEQDAFDYVRDLLGYLPPNSAAEPPRYPAPPHPGAVEDNLTEEDIELDTLIPDSPNQPYDMHEVITRILDDDEFLEVQSGYATNIIVGFGRVDGRPVGIVANQPTQFAGCLDINASEKAARFVRTCDCFNIPIVMLVDVPGFLPGTDQEYNGIIRRGAKLLYAYGEATVAKITVITRKAYGGAYCVMGSKDMGCDVNVAWPTAQIAVMGASGAVGFVYRSQLKDAANKGEDVDSLRLELQQDYEDTLVNPYIAAERGYVDAVIPPSHTRGYVAAALRLLERKVVQLPPKKHGNIPL
jgi:propionyl-CoA carboxylase beta chain